MNKWMAAVVLSLSMTTAVAGDLNDILNLTQTEFEGLSKDLTAAFSYKAVSPAEPLGILGFDAGLVVTATKLKYPEVWNKAAASADSFNTLPVPKLYLQKGLPLDFDIGVYYLTLPDSNLEAWGAELKYALLAGDAALPAVAIRAAYTTLLGIDELDLKTRSIDMSISKSILMVTPYAGVGQVWGDSKPIGAAATVLATVQVAEIRTFIGVSFTPAMFSLAVEGEKIGGIASYNLKLGLAF